ncbi:MAG TPA: hypothetical protein VFZ34_30830, partial [Blastocatellia bacterium]|nr:hypothetical protein [Blastocatellia bacterium]
MGYISFPYCLLSHVPSCGAYLNAEAYNNLTELITRLFTVATQALIRFPLKAKTTLREALTRFKSTLSLDPLTNKITGSISFDAGAREQPVP